MNYTILIISTAGLSVTDEADFSILASEGFRSIICLRELAALPKLDDLEPDLVILIERSRADSLGICRRLRGHTSIPVLIVGTMPCAEGWPQAVAAGADLYLPQPVGPRELASRVKAILRRHEWSLAMLGSEESVKEAAMNNHEASQRLSQMIKRQRIAAGLTLRALSNRSGVSASHLGRIERGERFPSANILRSIAGPLEFHESALFALAGYLSPQPFTGGVAIAEDSARQLDPAVASLLAQEPMEVQQAVIGILTILKSIARRSK